LEADVFSAKLRSAVESGHVMLDMAGTDFVDSTGIGLLIRLRKRARELGHQFFLIAPRLSVVATLRLMKLEEFFSIQSSIAGARLLIESIARTPVVDSAVAGPELQIQWVGEVTANTAIDLGARTESELAQFSPGMNVAIDLARVTFMDSAGIGLMLRFKKNLKRRDIGLTFLNPAKSVRNVLRLTKLEEYLLGEAR